MTTKLKLLSLTFQVEKSKQEKKDFDEEQHSNLCRRVGRCHRSRCDVEHSDDRDDVDAVQRADVDATAFSGV